ncbi:MAG: hypothetical protein CML04_00685 [Pseudozobellia sp.]|nr:hypothetical protein [Pseudozobellia sp.]MBG48074.1 hypothetical protein [Pseudozobellia sp.]
MDPIFDHGIHYIPKPYPFLQLGRNGRKIYNRDIYSKTHLSCFYNLLNNMMQLVCHVKADIDAMFPKANGNKV